MKFYESIAKYYDYIFPYNSKQIELIENELRDISDKVVLEVGAASGNLTKALISRVEKLEVFDLDRELIEMAKAKGIEIKYLNMLNIDKEYKENSFDIVVSFGNTLVHLRDANEIGDFLLKSKNVLKENGTLFLQIINYERIIDKEIKSLALIDNERIKFVRKYRYRKIENKIDFITELTVKDENRVIKNSIELYPIKKDELYGKLKEAGYSEIEFYGNFNKNELNEDSVPLIVVAK